MERANGTIKAPTACARMAAIVFVAIAVTMPRMVPSLEKAATLAPAREGAVRTLTVHVPGIKHVQTDEAWSTTVSQFGARWIRLHISNIVDSSMIDYQVVVFRKNLTRVVTYSKAEFNASVELWTPIIRGDFARVVVLSLVVGERPTGLSFTVDKAVYDAPGAVIESLIDRNNPKLRPITAYSADTTLQRVAESVAKLRGVGPDSNETCTGFMVSDDLLVTNEHCIPNRNICLSMLALFDWDPAVDDESPAKTFRCKQLERVDPSWDFAIVRLTGTPGDSAHWRHLILKPSELKNGDAIYVVQYPGISEPKQVARDGCYVTTAIAPGASANELTDFGHSCDTKGGSSGSPVLGKDNVVVGLHHWPFSNIDYKWCCQNRAVQIERVATEVSRLTSGRVMP